MFTKAMQQNQTQQAQWPQQGIGAKQSDAGKDYGSNLNWSQMHEHVKLVVQATNNLKKAFNTFFNT